MKHSIKDKDPFHDVKDWQDHRYDPGYYTGGNIHPLLKARRPNKYGYVLVFSGLIMLLPLWMFPDVGFYWLGVLLQ
jgi:hypothetical protein